MRNAKLAGGLAAGHFERHKGAICRPTPAPEMVRSEPPSAPAEQGRFMATQAQYALDNPFSIEPETAETTPATAYDTALATGDELLQRARQGGGLRRVMVQHDKDRMTVWERIKVLTDREPNILWQNWGPNLDGASIATGINKIRGRDVALYGHDFTLRAGSMDATNGAKLARLIYMAAEHGIPLI